MPDTAATTLRQVETLSDGQVEQLHALYQGEWWSAGRKLGDVRRMLTQSDLVVGLVGPDGTLVAFCRVLTDFVYHATLCDVIVAAGHRRRGIGRRLVEAAVGHPRLRDVPTVWLCCLPEMVPFYEQFGYTDGIGDLKWMRRVLPLSSSGEEEHERPPVIGS